MLLIALALARLDAQTPDLRMAMRTGATCHAETDRTSPVVHRYRVGEVVGSDKSLIVPGKGIWYFDKARISKANPTCWILAGETVPFDRVHPDVGYASVVDQQLARTQRPTFEELVEIDNLLESRQRNDNSPLTLIERFPLLQFKSLLVIDRALTLVDSRTAADAPLMQAWVIAHQGLLFYNEPSAHWMMKDSVYWALHDKNQGEPWAEELAWSAALLRPGGDECYADCHLGIIVSHEQRYWTKYPKGSHVAQALARATRWAADGVEGARYESPTREWVNRVRASLGQVTASEKKRLIDQLDKLERLAKSEDQ